MDRVIDRNIVKFGFYGFLKNLKFFEPFFYLYLLSIGLSYFQIGIILSVREVSVYIFEIPTGVIADVWGRKRSILACFLLYSISFAIYFAAHSFWALIPASVVFGLGEAFRLGTHKAIIFDYLDDRGMGHLRARVYGFTRAVALMGSALSAIGAGAVVLLAGNYHAGFLFSIVPYFLAFALVLTYPESSHAKSLKGGAFIWRDIGIHAVESIRSLRKVKDLRLSLVNSAIYDGAFKAGKDYVQPMILAFVTGAVASSAVPGGNADGAGTADTVIISAFYLCIYLVSAVCSQRAYTFKGFFTGSERPLNALFLLNAAALAGIALFSAVSLPFVLFFFMLLFVLHNLRRPILLDYLTSHIEPPQRATMLSVESQLCSLAVIVLAPALGKVADLYSVGMMFAVLAAFLFLLHAAFLRFRLKKGNDG